MNPPETNESLTRALDGWRVVPARQPQFRAAVWARVERARRGPSWSGYVRAHLAFAAGLMAAALVAGGWVGREQARARAAADRAALAENYVRALDARTMRMP
jgi:hypothetical protein